MGVDRVSSSGDSCEGCIIEDLLACREFQRLDDVTRVSSSDNCRCLPLPVVLERTGSAGLVT